MRKLFTVVFALAALAVGGAAPATADPVGGVLPPCADITGDAPFYDTTANSVSGSIRTVEPTCNGFRYTVVVSYTQSGVQKIAFFTHMGGRDIVADGNGLIKYDFEGIVADPILQPDGTLAPAVCMAYYSSRGNTIYDAVPDSAATSPPPVQGDGCPGWGLVYGGSPGGGGWYGG